MNLVGEQKQISVKLGIGQTNQLILVMLMVLTMLVHFTQMAKAVSFRKM